MYFSLVNGQVVSVSLILQFLNHGGSYQQQQQQVLMNNEKIFTVYMYKKVMLATLVEGDRKGSFSMATTPKCRVGRYSIPWIPPLNP